MTTTTAATLKETVLFDETQVKVVFTTPTGSLVWETATPFAWGDYTVTFTLVETEDKQPPADR